MQKKAGIHTGKAVQCPAGSSPGGAVPSWWAQGTPADGGTGALTPKQSVSVRESH